MGQYDGVTAAPDDDSGLVSEGLAPVSQRFTA
jgi:hypothetical protein